MNKINILMADGCTKSEAEKALNRTIIYTEKQFKESFDNITSWCTDEEEKEPYYRMLNDKIPATDWGITEYENETYFIAYEN